MTVRGSSAIDAALRVVVATVAGLALSWAFPPHGQGWLAPLAVAVFTVCVWRRGAWGGFGLGLVFGLATFLPLINWMRVVGDDAWVLLSLLCAFWIAVTGLMTALVSRLPLWPLWVATVWVTTEAMRDRIPWNGFAWGRLAFAQADTPFAFLAPIAGAPLVTFAVALVGSLLAAAALHFFPILAGWPRWGAPPRRSIGIAAVNLVLAGGVILGTLAASAQPVLPVAGTETTVTGAVVQGNVPRAGLGFLGGRREVLNNHLRETHRLAQDIAAGRVAKPEFVIWPENATDIDPASDPAISADIQSAVDEIGVPILVGAVAVNPANHSTVLNQGIVWNPGTGPAERYSKQHPVPFGEYIPMRSLLTKYIPRFSLIPHDFAPGQTPGVLSLGPAQIGDVICFEVADDEVVRSTITSGGHLLVVQTNNATYALTSQPAQQLAITRLRALEHGRTTMVASTSGISAIITPRGVVTDSLPEMTAGVMVTRAVQTDALTLSDRLGWKPEAALALIGVVAAFFAGITRRLGSETSGGRASRRGGSESREVDY